MDNKKVSKIVNQIWGTTKLLDAMDKKQNQYPEYMRPLYALRLLETVIIKEKESIVLKVGDDLNKIKENFLFREEEIGYNKKIIEEDYSLKVVVDKDLNVFEQVLNSYLSSFDKKTREILGVEDYKGKYLKFIQRKDDLMGDNKKHFEPYFKYCRAWSSIDFMSCTMEEIKFIDREIKRKWADISAVQAGDHYTPEDVSDLVSDIVCYYYKPNSEETNLYDMACGGGNMLFNVEDKMIKKSKEIVEKPYIETYGQEIDSELYALALVAGRFREDVTIEKNNSLFEEVKDDEQNSIKMDFVVSNPPHGKSWGGKELVKKVNDLQGEGQEDFYMATPERSDSQLLFLQHAIYKLKESGIAVIVSNGSPLFSGEAGSGESEIRRDILDNDYLEGIIQLPQNIFFNTDITTYLWIINKNKTKERKNKIILINASDMYEELKKNKGDKRNYIDENNRSKIVNLLNDFEGSKNSKVFDRSYFYYNKQKIDILNKDVNNVSIMDTLLKDNKNKVPKYKIKNTFNIKMNGLCFNKYLSVFLFINLFNLNKLDENGDINLDENIPSNNKSLINEVWSGLKGVISKCEKENFDIESIDSKIKFLKEKETWALMSLNEKNIINEYGNAALKFEMNRINNKLTMQITPSLQKEIEKDYEIIPYSFDVSENEENIKKFLNKWVDRPYEKMENVVGVEFNFNKIFYVPEELREIDSIERDLVKSYKNFGLLMEELIDMSKYE